MLRPNDMIQGRYYHSICLISKRWVYALGGHDNTMTIKQW